MTYYILQNDEPKGPYTVGQLRSMWNAGTITGSTLYRKEGEADWQPLRLMLDELEPPTPSAVIVRPAKSRGIYIILGLFFGLLGVHNFYAGYHERGVAQLLITLLLGWLIIGFFITGIWVLIDLISVTHDADGERMT